MTNSCVLRNRFPDPKITTEARIRKTAPSTNAPTVAGLTRLPMFPRRCFIRVFSAASEERMHTGILAIIEQVLGVAVRDHRSAFRVEKNAVVSDCKNTGQLVRDDHHRRAEVVAQLEDQVVEQARTYRIEAG